MNRVRGFRPLFLLALVFLLSACRSDPADTLREQPEIVWDEWGVPHIFASDLPAASYAWGWAQARNHGTLLVKLFGEARGRGAEYWGSELVEQDTWIRQVGIPKRGQNWYSQQEPEAKQALDAFVQGINDFMMANPGQVPTNSRAVLPILPSDVLSHMNRIIHFTFLSRPQSVLSRLRSRADSSAGSNAWAVAPGPNNEHAMLLINPHLPWSGFFTWMEGNIVTRGMNMYGAALLGMPFMALGFNDYLGWTHTVNTIDASDLYELSLQGEGYLWNGQVSPFEVSQETLKVLQEDGTLTETILELKSSIHGPVFEDGDRAIALRVAGLDHSQMLQQYLDMSRSRDLVEFEEVVARLQMPMFTLIYADREGHILSLFGGVVPRRPPGDWDWGGVVPGTSSETLWEETHTYGELPRVLDPGSGWVQNANEPPWTTTLPYSLDPADFPSYMAPRGMAFRPQSSVRLLSEKPATLEDLVIKANSSRMELAERLMDDLLPVLEAGTSLHRDVGEILQTWDRTADAGSRGSVLFAEFWRRLQRGGLPRGAPTPLFGSPWDPARPRQTPDGLQNPDRVRQTMTEAAEIIEERYGRLDVPWGDVYRLRRGGLDFPGSGGPGSLGIFRVVSYAPTEDNRFESVSGNSFVAAVEFTENGPRAFVLTTYGNSSNPDSIHYGDQLEVFAQKRMRPALLTREEALAQKSRVEELTFPGS